MKVALATSLHLDHGAMSLDVEPGAPLSMQAFVPVGLLSLKAFADRATDHRHAIKVLELNTLINAGLICNDSLFYDHLADNILQAGDELIGLMTDADSLHHTVALATRIRSHSPSSMICVGGPASSPMGERFLERFPMFDFLVRGEGEVTFAELLSALNVGCAPAGVAGLFWREDGRVKRNPPRPLIQDLDTLPVPSFDAYPETGTAALYLDVGRGCPYKCSFCATAPFWERRFRMKSIDRILHEIRLLRDRWGRSQVNFSHDIFTADRKWTRRFCEEVRNAKLGVNWTCSTRTDVIDAELLEHMAEAGCVEIYYGIETGSPEIQRRIQKHIDLDQAREIVAATASVGIRPVTGFIVGYPFETQHTLCETLERFFEFLAVGGFRAHLFSLCPFHEAPMFAEFSARIENRAEYYDLPLVGEALETAEGLIGGQRDVFASSFRYSTSSLDSALAAATEELSAPLVVLRRIWPLLLPHYASVLEWYRRWVQFIERENGLRYSTTRLRHQGNVADLLRFVSTEITRLGLDGEPVSSVARYESIKLAAATTLPPAAVAHNGSPLTSVTPVVRTGRFLTMPLRHDLGALVRGAVARNQDDECAAVNPDWVVFARTHEGTLQTVQVSAVALRLLELSEIPQPLGELINDALLRGVPASDPDHVECMRIVEQFIALKIMSEASPQ
jgi:tRNA A37 methylthiotransferase MiaB